MKLKLSLLAILLIGLLAMSALFVKAGTPDTNVVQTTMGMFYDYQGSNAPCVVNNSIAIGFPPNNATSFTNSNGDAFLFVGFVLTNTVSGYVTNWTTHAAYPFGSVTVGGTNYETIFCRLAPNDIYGILTNTPTGAGITYSEVRN